MMFLCWIVSWILSTPAKTLCYKLVVFEKKNIFLFQMMFLCIEKKNFFF